jgi:hypothetical protein
MKRFGESAGKAWRFFRGAVFLYAVGYGVLAYTNYKLAEAIPGEVVLKVTSRLLINLLL